MRCDGTKGTLKRVTRRRCGGGDWRTFRPPLGSERRASGRVQGASHLISSEIHGRDRHQLDCTAAREWDAQYPHELVHRGRVEQHLQSIKRSTRVRVNWCLRKDAARSALLQQPVGDDGMRHPRACMHCLALSLGGCWGALGPLNPCKSVGP